MTPASFNFLPNHVTFRGVHDPRWWAFEDSVTDFGQLDAQNVDLAKLLVMEFALVYGNDWFSVPIPAAIGSLASISTLVATDTFGVRTLIRPSEQTVVTPGESPWSMFKLSGNGERSNFIMLAPTLGLVQDAVALEEGRRLSLTSPCFLCIVEYALSNREALWLVLRAKTNEMRFSTPRPAYLRSAVLLLRQPQRYQNKLASPRERCLRTSRLRMI